VEYGRCTNIREQRFRDQRRYRARPSSMLSNPKSRCGAGGHGDFFFVAIALLLLYVYTHARILRDSFDSNLLRRYWKILHNPAIIARRVRLINFAFPPRVPSPGLGPNRSPFGFLNEKSNAVSFREEHIALRSILYTKTRNYVTTRYFIYI